MTDPERAPAAGEDPGAALVSAYAVDEDLDAEATLRPRRLADFIAQNRVREQLDLLLQGAMRRGARPSTSCCPGRPGLGKTTLAMIVAAELGAGLRITSGPAIERSGDLAAILTSLARGDVLFIDEIHRIARPAEELLYSAMEDFRVDVVVGKGPGATAIPLDVEPFTLVGATTRSGLLTGPMRDRFGFVGPPRLLRRRPSWTCCCTARPASSAVSVTDDGATEIAGRVPGHPRIANRLLRRVRDYAEVRADGVVDGRDRPGRAAGVRRGRSWPGPARQGGAERARALVRRWPGRPVDARRRGGRAARHGRGGV